MTRAYTILCWVVGGLLVLFGVQLVRVYLQSMMPGGDPGLPFPLGPNGLYFAAFAGTGLVGWGGCLVGAGWRGRREPGLARAVGTATATALVLAAVYRMAAWLMGDLAWVGDLLRAEAAVMLLLALAFVWLRPDRPPRLADAGEGS